MSLLLGLNGSLRAHSSNGMLLEACAALAPQGARFAISDFIARLPHFNPDIEARPPAVVLAFRAQIAAADALVISCPEYARGIPGAFKNALDWLVGDTQFPGKRVALFNASPRASDAQAALRLVLTTMSATIVAEACLTVPLMGRGLDADAIVADETLAAPIRAALTVLGESAAGPDRM